MDIHISIKQIDDKIHLFIELVKYRKKKRNGLKKRKIHSFIELVNNKEKRKKRIREEKEKKKKII